MGMCLSILLSCQTNRCLTECFVGRGHDPADQVPIFDQGAFIGIARKSLHFGGVMTPPYGTPPQIPICLAAEESGYAHMGKNLCIFPRRNDCFGRAVGCDADFYTKMILRRAYRYDNADRMIGEKTAAGGSGGGGGVNYQITRLSWGRIFTSFIP